jgi:hypothetical protein
MDRKIEYSQAELLADANRLASTGLRHAALDILLEYLNEYPQSARVLAAVGRLYLLEKNFQKSVHYLKKSLQVDRKENANSAAIDAYEEGYDDQDLQYAIGNNSYFDLEGVDPKETDIIAIVSSCTETDRSQSQGEIEDKDFVNLPFEYADLEPTKFEEDDNDATSEPCDDDQVVDSRINQYELSLESVVLDEEIESTFISIDEIIAQQIVDLDSEFVEIGEADDVVQGEEIYPDVTLDVVSDEAYELTWEEIDDLDGYSATPQHDAEPVVGKGTLTRAQRARQVAVDVMVRFELENDFLAILETIFFESGWGPTRVAIERELTRGTSCEELAIAREVRHFWWNSDRYWTTFRGIHSNAVGQQAEAAYKIMSWAESLRLVACFPDLPSIEEIEVLIEETFILWYESRNLRRSYPVFFKFLKYRTGSMPGTLSRREPRFFDSFDDDGVEDTLFKCDGAAEELRRQLWELGIDIYKVRQSEHRLREHPEEI